MNSQPIAALMAAEAEVADVQREMAEPGAFDDPGAAKALSARHTDAKNRAMELGVEWEKLVDDLAKAEASAARA